MSTDAPSLQNKHVAIIGGSSGVGLALGRVSAAAGARVTLLARDEARLQAAASQVPNAKALTLDLLKSETVARAAEALDAVDHLVITAGTFGPASLADSDPEDWRRKFEERIVGPSLMIKLLAPRITRSITLFSGLTSRRPYAGIGVGAALAAGLEGLTRALALELSPVRVNVIVPGMIDTPMLDQALGANKAQIWAETERKLPARHIASADDAAQAVLFLMTNPYVTGASIVFDGGAVMI